jgi:hypothetical protein
VACLAQYAMTKHGLVQAIWAAASPGSALLEESYSPIVAALGRVLAAAEQAGVVRAGLDPGDVILAWQACGRSTLQPTGKLGRAPCTTSYSLGAKLTRQPTRFTRSPPANLRSSGGIHWSSGWVKHWPQLCGRANPDSVIEARFELRWLCARTC